ncbi:MAG: carboxypeptidase-like regulatory domain-containing protein [archaeon]
MKTGFNAITAVMLFFLLVSATAAGNGFIVPLFDSQKISGLTVQKQPEIKAELKPNLETLNITVQEFNAIIQETSIKKSFSVQGKQAVSKDSTECSALSENQKIPAPTQALLDISCQGQASIGGCSGLNCSGIQSLLCSYCSSVNPSINHLSSCTPSSCPSGYFDQGVVCQPSGACNNCDGSNCDYDCAHQSLSCTRTCTTNPCTNPDYPNYCDGYCWSNCSSVGLYGGKCCNGSWRCCNSSSYPQLCCPDSGNPIMCTTQNDSCLSNGCSVNYPYKCNNKCWSCPTGTNLCCPSSGDPSHCCGTGQVCQSSGTCYTPPTNARIYGYLKDHYGNPLPGRTMRLTDCSDNTQYSDTTESNGYWEIIAPANSFKLKTDVWWGTIVWNVSGQECYSYSAQDYFLGDLQVNTETVNYGYLKNEYGNGWNNILVELTSCSDNVIISDRTNLDGYFNLRALKGNYKLKTHMPWGVIEWTVNEVECPLYYWNEWNIGTLPINANAIVSGQIVGHQNNGLQGVEAKLTQCFGSNSYSDFTDLQGNFSVSAPKNYYKFQTVFGWGTIKWIIDNNECNLFTGNNISLGTLPKIDSTIHGYFHDLDNNPISGLRVELFDCSDNFVAYVTTSSTGFFSIYNDAGKYQLKVVIQGYRIPLTDLQGNSCFVFFGDLDLGTLNINPSINCSGFNNTCYNNNWRLFSCYFDSTVPSCVCYYEVCEFGCTERQNYCNAGQQELIKIDVDSINNNFNALPGARIYLDNEFKGTTDSFGKKDVYAFPGFRTIKVLCPDSSFCSEKGIYLNSTAWEYFDCSCGIQKGDIQVNVDNANDYPVANVYVFLDEDYSKEAGLTNAFGFTYIEGIAFGSHRIDIRYKVTNPDYAGDYQITQYINLNQPKQTVDFTAIISSSYIISDSGNSADKNFGAQAVPIVAVALAAVDVISVGLSTEEYCKCINNVDGEAFGGGYENCFNSIKQCSGNMKSCIDVIREEAGPTAKKCWFEEIMLAGDAASPLIPLGMVGHGAVAVGKSSAKTVKIIDSIGKGIGKIATDLWAYGKQGIDYFARWLDNTGVFKKAVNLGFDTTKWGDEAIEGLEYFVKSSPDGQKAAKRIAKELGEDTAEEAFKALTKLEKKGIDTTKLRKAIYDSAIDLDNQVVKYGEQSAQANIARGSLNGYLFEAKASSHTRFIDDVSEISHVVKDPATGLDITDFDAIRKNNSILEFKTSYPTAYEIKSKINKLYKAKLIENRGSITFVFENQPLPEAINVLQEAVNQGKILGWEIL